MRIYEAEVTREGKWWMIAVPDLGGITQARRISEIDTMAREYIAASLGLELNTIAVRLRIGDIVASSGQD